MGCASSCPSLSKEAIRSKIKENRIAFHETAKLIVIIAELNCMAVGDTYAAKDISEVLRIRQNPKFAEEGM